MNGRTVLIAEDDALLRRALADRLVREGFDVHVARNGVECLEQAFALHPDLLLLDILMPRMDGMTVLQTLREDDTWGAMVKIVLLTNVSDVQDMAEKNPYRCDGYLPKASSKLASVVEKVAILLDARATRLASPEAGPAELPDYRCDCGKLLFKGALLFSTVEIKCKRCGAVKCIDTADYQLG